MSESLDRRQFNVAAALALLGGATITIGCGGGSNNPNSPTPNPSQDTGNIVGSVAGNHPLPHIAEITAAQLSAGVGLVLDISNGLHSHSVTLSGAQVMEIAGRARLFVDSSTDPHSSGTDPHHHMVTFN